MSKRIIKSTTLSELPEYVWQGNKTDWSELEKLVEGMEIGQIEEIEAQNPHDQDRISSRAREIAHEMNSNFIITTRKVLPSQNPPPGHEHNVVIIKQYKLDDVASKDPKVKREKVQA